MIKRILAFLLAALMLLGVAAMTVQAAPEDQGDLASKTRWVYRKSLASASVESFKGYCGKLAAHQLYHLGVTRYAEIRNGKDHYDYHVANPVSSGGCYVSAYSAEEYTLEEALNAVSDNGTRDVYNILLGFQWTSTEAGGLYGHAGVITGIEDGIVYMTEGYYTPMAGEEGNLIRCSIPEVAAFYDSWTVFEGLIHFSDTYAGACKRYGTDLFVRPRFDISLRSEPCVIGQNHCQELRSISAGERLRVTAVLEDPHGDLYYEVQDADQTGYIVAQTTVLERTNAEELSVEGFASPRILQPGSKGGLQGTVRAEHGLVGEVELVVTDSEGKEVVRQRRVADSYTYDLSQFDEALPLDTLQEGSYTLSLYASTASACVREDQLDYSYATRLLKQRDLWVGDLIRGNLRNSQQPQEEAPLHEGWVWENGTWYYYEAGSPRKGWLRSYGVEYYLREDGSVTTGWAKVEGEDRFFSDTGALCVGWLRTQEGMRYSLSDGSFAHGWQIIGTSLYYFDNGILQTQGERTKDEVKYEFQEDGRAIPTAEKEK
ncbi:MAG: hypothetical protein J6A74_04910 [Oscillospiraceae bacterium]|nr:hypothetical protein [Oscillospiraceae bacterium]